MESFEDITFEKNTKLAFKQALGYLSHRARSIGEMNNYLQQKKFDSLVIEATIDQLKRHNYLNDTEYAQMFIENKKRFNPKSRYALRYELSIKGIAQDLIDCALKDVNDNEFALLAVKSKLKLWENLDKIQFKTKLMNYLKNRGFNYEVSIITYRHIVESKEDKKGPKE
ncbi:MAG: regulatory protein RecX [Desulfobacteraceae bacterium]|nr:regulatory protein RecX [Desulfobacteraceae bacterium]